jgi:hypothetical protein
MSIYSCQFSSTWRLSTSNTKKLMPPPTQNTMWTYGFSCTHDFINMKWTLKSTSSGSTSQTTNEFHVNQIIFFWWGVQVSGTQWEQKCVTKNHVPCDHTEHVITRNMRILKRCRGSHCEDPRIYEYRSVSFGIMSVSWTLFELRNTSRSCGNKVFIVYYTLCFQHRLVR